MKMPSSKCKGICQRCGAKSIKFLGPMGKFSSLLQTAPDTGNSLQTTQHLCENPESLWIFFMHLFISSPEKLHVYHVGRFLPIAMPPPPISPTSRGATPNRPHRSCKRLWKRSPGPFPIRWFLSAAPQCCAWTYRMIIS